MLLRWLPFALSFCLFATGTQAQDTLFKKNNEQVICYFAGQKADTLFYHLTADKKGEIQRVPTADVARWGFFSNERSPRFTRSHSLNSDIIPRNGDDDKKKLQLLSDSSFVRSRNAFSGQILGLGGLFSVGYDRLLWENEKLFLAAGLGVGMIPNGVSIPHYLTVNLGKKRHYVELGVGGTFATGSFTSWNNTNHLLYGIAPVVGYRFQPARGFFLRTYICPTVFVVDKNDLLPGAFYPYTGVDLGYCF